jgi:hypothetical protein
MLVCSDKCHQEPHFTYPAFHFSVRTDYSLCVAHEDGVLGCTVLHQVWALCQKMVFPTVSLAQYSICQYDHLPPDNQVNRLFGHHDDTQHQLCADDI